MTHTEAPALQQVLTDLTGLLPEQRDVLRELGRRLGEQRLRVLVVGEAKRGKSSLVNALVGRSLLPVGVVPLTSVATVLRHGARDRLTVQFLDGSRQDRPFEDLPELVTEAGNPDNARGVAEVTVELPAPLLIAGIELVDTPGVGSVHEHNTADATRALDRMDVAILVLTADPPISASERRFLRAVRKQAVTVLYVLNKVDRLDPAELSETTVFTEHVLAAEVGGPVNVWPLSARAPTPSSAAGPAPGAQDGLSAFTGHLQSYLADQRDDDLALSVCTRARRLAAEGLAGLDLTLSALSVSAAQLHERLTAHAGQLDVLHAQQADNAAIAAGQVRELLAMLNDSAHVLLRDGLPQVRSLAASRAHSAPAGERLADTEAAALDVAAAFIRRLVSGWEQEQARQLEQELVALQKRLTGLVREQVMAVRVHAGELFEVDLPDPEPRPSPPAARLPDLSFTDDPGNTTAMLALGRQHLPVRWGRGRAARHVADRAELLLDRNVGRARARLQRHLHAEQARLTADLDRQAHAGLQLVSGSLEQARELHSANALDGQDVRARLAGRRAALTVALARLPVLPTSATTPRSS